MLFRSSVGGIQLSPDGIDVDSKSNLIIADSGNNRIVILDKDGKTITSFGKIGIGNSQFKMPKGISVSTDDDLFVVDSSNHRIQKFGSNDVITESTTDVTPQTNPFTIKPTVNDLKKPTVSPPKDLYVEATGGLTRVLIGQAIATDESGIKSISNNAPDEFPLGITTVIWTAIDNAGNMGIATQTITVGDSTPPVIYGITDITQETKGTENMVNLGVPKVDDLVGVLSVTNDAPSIFPLGKTVVTWTATDVAKNEATATQTITIIDTKSPKVIPPEDVTSEATSLDKNIVSLGEPTITDYSTVSSVTNDAPEFFPLGETIVTWTAVDVSGNIGTAKQKITILDSTKPEFGPLDELTIEATSDKQNLIVLIPPIMTDIQDVSVTNDAPEFFPLGETIVTWTARDISGNNSTFAQKINVVDTSAPILNIPSDIVQEATGKFGNIVSLGDASATDTTGVSSISHNGPSDYPIGTTMVSWTATDNYGNAISKTQNVTIIDTTAPKISAPTNIIFEASSLTVNEVNIGSPRTSDLVEVSTVTNDAPEFFPLGETIVTWTATDSAGLLTTATQKVIIIDTIKPEIHISNVEVEATSESMNTVDLGEIKTTDKVEVTSITNDAPENLDRKSTRLNSSHIPLSRMPSSA